jgi:hypothetical protein
MLRDRGVRTTGVSESRRAAGETGLPWTLALESISMQTELDRFANRRRIWLAGLVMLAVLVMMGTYMIRERRPGSWQSRDCNLTSFPQCHTSSEHR